MTLILGFSPFILFAVLSRLSADLALWAAFAAAFVVTIRDFVESPSLRLLDVGNLAVFGLLALARGFLAGNRTRTQDTATMRAKTDDFAQSMYYRDNDFAVVEQLKQVAATRGVAPAQIALAWVLAQPGVTAPIIGASRIEQLNELGAALSIKLSEDECRTLQAVYQPHPVLGHS